MEETEDCTRNKNPIVFQLGRFFPCLCEPRVLDPAVLDPHVDLSSHHVLVEPQMALGREEPVAQVQPLDTRVIRRGPDVYFVVLRPEQVGRFRRRHGRHLVLVHLVQLDRRLLRPEELLATFREF